MTGDCSPGSPDRAAALSARRATKAGTRSSASCRALPLPASRTRQHRRTRPGYAASTRSCDDASMSTSVTVLPGAEPFEQAGGPVGVLLCHGFTGTPQTLRPWADYLADKGLTVSLPRLPGHGTTWQDMSSTGWHDWFAEVDRAFTTLAGQCEEVFVFGLSMG